VVRGRLCVWQLRGRSDRGWAQLYRWARSATAVFRLPRVAGAADAAVRVLVTLRALAPIGLSAAPRQAAREERDAKTRRYRLGQALEGFLFDEPELLAQLKDVVQHEPLKHVRVAFRLVGGGPSWLDKPDGDDSHMFAECSALNWFDVHVRSVSAQLVDEASYPEGSSVLFDPTDC
jgi:hypothetical protein